MEYLHSQDGHPFIRAVAQYIRQHEKALANSLQLHVQRRKPSPTTTALGSPTGPGSVSQASTSTLAAALSFAGLSFRSHSVKSAQLTLTPHHLFYLLSRIEELEVDIGPMNIRMESIHNDSSPANYVSFLQTHKAPKGRSDADSIHSVSSIRSVMSGMSALWSAMGVSNGSKSEKARLALENDMKYIYGAFTKLPCLRLTPDHRTPLIKGYEQFPFDTAVPLFAFKNLQQLEIIDLDFRTFYGWDRLAEQLRLLTIRRGNLDDPIDLLEHIVLDDAEKRRRRSNRSYANAPSTPSWSVPSTPRADYARSQSDGGSPERTSPGTSPGMKAHREDYAVETTPVKSKNRTQSTLEGTSPKRPTPRRPASSYRHVRTYSLKAKRSGSGSSNNSDSAYQPGRDEASTNAAWNVLPASKWQRLVYLSLADNGLTLLPERSLQAVAPSLRSLNLSSNLFTEIPDGLARLSRLQSLDLSNCMIESLRSLAQHPLPAVTTLKLKSNRLSSIAGIEQLHSLENLHLQDNKITDPDEAARLTCMPNFRRLWIKHNPLTKSYYDFRVRIMNHFRRTPGFLEDIVLDDQPATFSERKQLVERVAEAQPPPVSQPDVAKQKVVLVQEPSRNPQHPTEAGNRLSLVTNLQKEPSGASTRRKNGPKRRIIDLSADEANSPIKDRNLEDAGITSVAISENTVATNSSSAMETMLFIPRFTPPQIPVDHDEMAKPLTKNSSSGDDYRFNVEDLRLKFGNTWLSALGDQHVQWPSESDLTTLCATHQPPKLHHYHSSPPVLDVGAGMP